MKSEEGESEVIKQVLSGDKNAFESLVVTHQDLIFAMIMRQVGHVSTAEELTQEVFIKAFKNLKSFNFEAKFSTWLTRIAINHTTSFFRSRRFKESKQTEAIKEEANKVSEDKLSSGYELKEQLAAFRNCFKKLGPKFQAIITLCGLEERSYEEAALIAEVPLGTVRSRLNKARLLLKDCMSEL